MENERIKIYQGLKADGETDLGFVDFKKKYFGSEQATSNFYQMLVSAQDPKGVFYYNDTIQNFFKKYACDLFPNSTYCGGSGSSTPTANVFSCIEAVHTSGKAYTSGKTQLHITRDGGIKHIFKNDYGFAYKDGDKYQWGTWACVGTNGYKITLRNGQTFSSTDLKWSAVPPKGNTPNQTPPTGGGTETKLNAGDLILYPSTSLHEVKPVIRGKRLAAFFWIQSMVANAIQREQLFELDQSIQVLTQDRGSADNEVRRLSGLYHNLLRGWASV